MWRQLLREALGAEAEKFEVIEVARSGASGPKVLFLKDFTTDQVYAFKYGRPEQLRVPIVKQVANRRVIAPLFGEHHLPQIIISDTNFLMMPAVKGHDLHESVVSGIYDLDYLLAMEDKILHHFGRVWQSTAVPLSGQKLTRDPLDRAARIRHALLSRVFDSLRLEGAIDKTVVINGEKFPSLGELLDRMVKFYEPPKNVVTCHGDPNADNILINDYHGWWLIDWEWVGLHDWRVLVSHLIGWWLSNASLLVSRPTIEVNHEIKFSYQLGSHSLVKPIVDSAWNFAASMGKEWQEESWQRQVNLQLAILLLGDVRFLEARGRTHHVIPLLGEGLKTLAAL